MRNLLIKQGFREMTPAESKFFDKWAFAIPTTRALLTKQIKELEG